MIDIDFLPDKYRERYHVRYQRIWRITVTALFAGVVIGSATLQHWLRYDAEQRLEKITTTHVESLKINQRLSVLYRQLDARKNEAALLTYLRHRWPTTQLLQHALVPLEQGIRLDRVRVFGQVIDPQAARRLGRPDRARDSSTKEREPAMVRDLELLRGRYDSRVTILEISGVADDLAAFHRYVGKLAIAPLFQRVEITQLESKAEGGDSERTEFRVRIEVKPGPGQRTETDQRRLATRDDRPREYPETESDVRQQVIRWRL